MVHKSILSAIGVKAQHNQVTTDPLFQSEVILSVEWMSRVAVVDGDYCPVLEKCTTTPLLSIIPGVSSVVRPNTPLHDQEQGEVTAGTHQPHHSRGRSRRFGRDGEHWTQPPAWWWVQWVPTHPIVSLLTEQCGGCYGLNKYPSCRALSGPYKARLVLVDNMYSLCGC